MITITQCDISQLYLLAEIAITSYKQTYNYLWLDEAEAYLKKFYDTADFKTDIAKPGVYYFFVYADDELVGYFKLKESLSSLNSEKKCLEIEKLYLLQSATGKGIGKTVMNFIFDFANKKQCTTLLLQVMESSPAKLFYESYGFKQTGRARLDYPFLIDEYRWILTYVLELLD
ncbi:GNAT family N-acetyltransferase [Mucilaginibacter flavidus]|uniref:GNAT family N-acetyltransferase n=1 Tax=Mucilaginibacter flavidus TaxID=2949309 RepID=UPI002093A4A3|nr:GNAT family N-acetyltransferase [Mucilaginibacter flavidus]MCO5947031.1 GNAT family N-acetyltransferase [Mucilaginibacter flavidus]